MNSIPAYWFNATGKTQRLTVSRDSGGGVINTYADYLTSVAMRFNVPSGNQQAGRARIDGVKTVKIFISGAPDIVANDRIVYSARVFDIKAVRNVDEAGVFLTIDAVEVQPSAVLA